jgi:uncharacterized membrane protein
MPVDFEKLLSQIDPEFRHDAIMEEVKLHFPGVMMHIAPAIWCLLFNEAMKNKDQQGVSVTLNAALATCIYFAITLKTEEMPDDEFKKALLDTFDEMLTTALGHQSTIRSVVPQMAGAVGTSSIMRFVNGKNVEVIQDLVKVLHDITEVLKRK